MSVLPTVSQRREKVVMIDAVTDERERERGDDVFAESFQKACPLSRACSSNWILLTNGPAASIERPVRLLVVFVARLQSQVIFLSSKPAAPIPSLPPSPPMRCHSKRHVTALAFTPACLLLMPLVLPRPACLDTLL